MASNNQKKVKNLPGGCLKLVFWTIPKWIVIAHAIVIGTWLVIGFLMSWLVYDQLDCVEGQNPMVCIGAKVLFEDAYDEVFEQIESIETDTQSAPLKVDSLNPGQWDSDAGEDEAVVLPSPTPTVISTPDTTCVYSNCP